MVSYISSFLMLFIAAAEAQPMLKAPNLQPVTADTDAIVGRFNYFDLELLKEFGNSGNVLISPASIKSTLAMVLEGARGHCAQEIGTALRINDINANVIREQLTKLLFELSDSTPTTILESANSIFINDRLIVVPEYERKLRDFYKASVVSLNFNNANLAAQRINSWAKNYTHGEIQEIVNAGSLHSDTTIVLANALYFKGKWKSAFDIRNTQLKCFESTKGCVKVPTMQIAETFNYNLVSLLNAHAVEIPYEGDKYSMLILLPAEGNTINVLVRDMQHANFYNIVDELRPMEIVLDMPKFEIRYTSDLIPYLQQLNIHEIFGPKSNLTGIVRQENIRISNIVHTTMIEVNELGTKAAAATAAVVIPLIGSSSLRLKLDHPFMFFIYHKESRNIIFEGIYSEPIGQVENNATPLRASQEPVLNEFSTVNNYQVTNNYPVPNNYPAPSNYPVPNSFRAASNFQFPEDLQYQPQPHQQRRQPVPQARTYDPYIQPTRVGNPVIRS